MSDGMRKAKVADRRKDARQKIELGGLLVKAGLREESKAALYGGILELAKNLQNETEKQRLEALGREALKE